ncbi:hypothetical protein B7C42_03125 [Nocardia cerradoensis]|uniref:Carotenoid biosynthesis protein n=1 Tax=Nocardia cerradoensis TaxID=85688 RepID=A0A231H8Z7_9NOCA|nr:hypothetical protein [Nocardia cerradoensis]OXR45167.1 hypothetical protein B7C42_03125 [Nocardia cerradoensis]
MSNSVLAVTQYPVPPLDLSAPSGLSWVFTVLCVVFGLVAVGYGAWLARRGEVMGLALLVGGLLTCTFEPLADYIGLLWFADDNVAVTVNLVGRHIPLYVVVGYMFFFGLLSYIDYRAIVLGAGRKYFLGSFAIAFVFDWTLQATGANFDLYRYYGADPFRIFGAPLWWFAIDGSATVLIAFVMFILRHRIVGWGRLLPVVCVLPLYAGWNAAVGMPIFAAKNSNFDPAVNGNGSNVLVLIGGLLTFAAVAFFGWIILGEIQRAQRGAGIPVMRRFSLRTLLFAPLAYEPVDARGARSSAVANQVA